MASFYLDLQKLTTGTGTETDPWGGNSGGLTAAQAIAASSILNVSGYLENVNQGFGTTLTFTQNNITVQQWPGKKRFCLNGAKGVPSGWTYSGTAGCYQVSLTTLFGDSLAICQPDSVTWRYWDSANMTAEGARKAFLLRVVDAATVLTTLNSWFYNNATGVLYVNVSGLVAVPATYTTLIDPTDATATTVSEIQCGRVSPPQLLFQSTGSGVTVDGIWAANACPMSNTASYCIWVGGPNATVRNCRSWNAAFHCIGVLNGDIRGSRITNCDAYNVGVSGGSAGTNFVVFTNTTNNISNIIYESCRSYGSYHLGRDGNELAAGTGETKSGTINCFYAHTLNTCRVTDLEYRNCTAWCGTMSNVISASFGVANGSLAFGDKDDPTAYPHRMVGCVRTQVQTTATAGIVRPTEIFYCSTFLDRCKLSYAWKFGTTIGVRSNGSPRGAITCAGATNLGIDVRWRSCDIELQQGDNGAFALGHFAATDQDSPNKIGNSMGLINCTVRELSNLSVSTGFMFMLSPAQVMYYAKNTIFINMTGNASNKVLDGGSMGTWADTATIRGTCDFSGNVYVGYNATNGYSNATAADSAAEFIAASPDNPSVNGPGLATDGVDPRATTMAYTAGDFANINENGALTGPSAIRALLRSPSSSKIFKSVDGYFHTGYGAYAYGPRPDSDSNPLAPNETWQFSNYDPHANAGSAGRVSAIIIRTGP